MHGELVLKKVAQGKTDKVLLGSSTFYPITPTHLVAKTPDYGLFW